MRPARERQARPLFSGTNRKSQDGPGLASNLEAGHGDEVTHDDEGKGVESGVRRREGLRRDKSDDDGGERKGCRGDNG